MVSRQSRSLTPKTTSDELKDVVKELSDCFNNDDKKIEAQNFKRRLSSFLIYCVRVLFNPWKWRNVVGVVVKLILISANLSSTIQLYRNLERKTIVPVMYSKEKEAEKLDSLLIVRTKNHRRQFANDRRHNLMILPDVMTFPSVRTPRHQDTSQPSQP